MMCLICSLTVCSVIVKCIGYFFIGPAFRKVFNNRLFSICELKPFLGLISIKLLPTPKLF